jgi:hypothetical protein
MNTTMPEANIEILLIAIAKDTGIKYNTLYGRYRRNKEIQTDSKMSFGRVIITTQRAYDLLVAPGKRGRPHLL